MSNPSVNLFTGFKSYFTDNNGNPLASGYIYTYVAGTGFSVPATTYQDSGGTTPNTNPIRLDGAGRANLFLDASKSYDIDIRDNTNTSIYTELNISGSPVATIGNPASLTMFRQLFTATAGQTLFNLSFTYIPNTNALRVFLNGVYLISGVDFTETSSTSITVAAGLQLNDNLEVSTGVISGNQYQGPAVVSTFNGTATSGQTVFNLGFSYVPGNNSLQVYMNGLRLINTIDYTETSSTSITLTNGASSGDLLEAFYGTITSNSVIDSVNVTYANNTVSNTLNSIESTLANNISNVKSQELSTSVIGFPSQAGTQWESQYHANWNVIQSQIPYNPTEWQIYTNGANGICTVNAGANTVTYVSGSAFDPAWIGHPYFYFEGNGYTVTSVSGTTLTVKNTDGSPVTWGATATGTFYFCYTSVTSVVNVSGTSVTYVSGQPFISLFDQVTINGTPVTATYVDQTHLTLSASLGVITNATLMQTKNIAFELANLRIQGLNGANEENFVITLSPAKTTIQHTYAGQGKYRPIQIGSGENPAGTFNPHIGIYPNSTLGSPGWLTIGGDYGHQVMFINQNANNVNYMLMQGGPTTVSPSIAVRGADSAVGFGIDTQGADTVTFTSHSFSNVEFQIFGVGGNSWIGVGSSSNNAPILSANGVSANVDIQLSPKGSGSVWLGAYSAGAPTAGGYITVKDSTGTIRKLLCL